MGLENLKQEDRISEKIVQKKKKMQLIDFLIDYTILRSRVWGRNSERYIESYAINNTRKSKNQYKNIYNLLSCKCACLHRHNNINMEYRFNKNKLQYNYIRGDKYMCLMGKRAGKYRNERQLNPYTL